MKEGINETGMTMDQVESLLSSILKNSGISLRATDPQDMPNVPKPEDVDTGDRTRLLKGIKQVTFEEYEGLTEEERKQYVFFVREESGATFGFVGIGNLKYTMVPEDIRGIDCGFFPVCSGDTPDTGETPEDICMPDSGWSTGNTPENMFFTIYGLSNGNVKINRTGTTNPWEIEYKYGVGDKNWHRLDEEFGSVELPIKTGEIIEFLGIKRSNSDSTLNFTGTTARFSVYGNIVSLYAGYGDWEDGRDANEVSVPGLFKDCDTLCCAKHLVLPGLDLLPEGGYSSMFQNCTNLQYAPEVLPATNANAESYMSMFEGCELLTEAPEIKLENAPDRVCKRMFAGCTSLAAAPELLASSVGESAYEEMFSDCHSLVTSPSVLPAETVPEYAYKYMFENCYAMTTVPEILATDIYDYGCVSMFWECRSIVDASNMTLAYTGGNHHQYETMFANCSSLVTAPTILLTDCGEYSCAEMFENCTSLVNVPELLFENVQEGGCMYMFRGCTSLVDAPIPPASETSYKSYEGMFKECSSLVNVPDLEATYVDERAYAEMFMGCTSLVRTPRLGFETASIRGCQDMFRGCTSLTTVTNLPNNTTDNCNLDEGLYAGMFADCASLVEIPELNFNSHDALFEGTFEFCTSLERAPGKIVVNGNWSVCQSMFAGCSSLVEAPELPGTNLDNYCYRQMFMDCTSLVEAPELPAQYLSEECYALMFAGCSSLNHIKCGAIEVTSYPNTTLRWVDGVAPSGVFEKSERATDWEIDSINGIPVGWTVGNYLDYRLEYLTFNITEPGEIRWAGNDADLQYSFDDGQNWENLDVITVSEVPAKMLVRGTNYNHNGRIGTFSGDAKFEVCGNIKSLLYGDGFRNEQNEMQQDNMFERLFEYCEGLTSAACLVLPFNYVNVGAYSHMFFGCTNLEYAPELPAMEVDENGYTYMFAECHSLINAPEIPATTLSGDRCYCGMFSGCENLVNGPSVLPASVVPSYGYNYMFENCYGLQHAPDIMATEFEDYACESMFWSCHSLTYAPSLTARRVSDYCFSQMFYDCNALRNINGINFLTDIVFEGSYQSMFGYCLVLETAPALPATTLGDYCYQDMFDNCANITVAPELPATTLTEYCYSGMFNGCTNLNYIKCLAENNDTGNALNNWVNGVAATGTFVKSPVADWWEADSVNGIPAGWTVQDA